MVNRETELHNRLAGEIVRSIVVPVVEGGGTTSEILVLLESVNVGVLLAVAKLGGDEPIVDVLTERVKSRLAEIRLTTIETKGSA